MGNEADVNSVDDFRQRHIESLCNWIRHLRRTSRAAERKGDLRLVAVLKYPLLRVESELFSKQRERARRWDEIQADFEARSKDEEVAKQRREKIENRWKALGLWSEEEEKAKRSREKIENLWKTLF